MTRQKSFKNTVRSRMAETGESYTAARRRILEKQAPDAPRTGAQSGAGEASEGIGAHRPAAVAERTGRSWEEWFALLDAWGATARDHTEIARHLVREEGVGGWWAQSITVAYEQERGMRLPGQMSDGTFSVTGSRTVAVPVQRLFAAFADEAFRDRWLPGAGLRVRTATEPKNFRADWEGGGLLVAGFTAKGEAKSHVGIAHERLPDAEQAARTKAYWRERLAALKALLEEEG